MRAAVVATPKGFDVYADNQDWRSYLKTFSYGDALAAFALADEVDEILDEVDEILQAES